MGFLSGLFGGGSDIPPSSKLRNLDITPNEWKALRSSLARRVSGATSGESELSLSGIPEYEGSYTAALTDQERSLIDRLFNRAGEPIEQAEFDELLDMYSRGGSALQQAGESQILRTLAGEYLDPDSNPWLSKTVDSAQAELQSDWDERVLPNLQLSFTGSGQTVSPGSYGSSLDRAMALAANEQTRQIQDLATEIYGQNYQAERDRMMQALGYGQAETGLRIGARSAGLSAQQERQNYNLAERQAQTDELLKTLEAVALPRLIEQHGIDQGVAQFNNRVNQLLQLLGLEYNMASGFQANVQPTQNEGQMGNIIGAVGAGAGIAAAAGAFTSDRRLKERIIKLGVKIKGIPLYEFSYLGKAKRWWGVMADEVPSRSRILMPSGFYAVNYRSLV